MKFCVEPAPVVLATPLMLNGLGDFALGANAYGNGALGRFPQRSPRSQELWSETFASFTPAAPPDGGAVLAAVPSVRAVAKGWRVRPGRVPGQARVSMGWL